MSDSLQERCARAAYEEGLPHRWQLIYRGDARYLPGRSRFIMPGDDHIRPNARPPFGLVLLIWRPADTPYSTVQQTLTEVS
jgi:hypothetical protein